MTCLLLVSGQTVWRRDVRDVAVPLGFARPEGGKCVAWRGERETRWRKAGVTRWRKRGVSLVSGMICGIV